MSTNYQAFVRHLEKQCGEKPSFVALLRSEKKDEALKRILEKSEITLDEDVIKKVSFHNITLSIYETGKIILHGIEEKEEAIKLLNNVLSS